VSWQATGQQVRADGGMPAAAVVNALVITPPN
jgi:hypothetical protein